MGVALGLAFGTELRGAPAVLRVQHPLLPSVHRFPHWRWRSNGAADTLARSIRALQRIGASAKCAILARHGCAIYGRRQHRLRDAPYPAASERCAIALSNGSGNSRHAVTPGTALPSGSRHVRSKYPYCANQTIRTSSTSTLTSTQSECSEESSRLGILTRQGIQWFIVLSLPHRETAARRS
jgi:hypothetical protein